MKASRDSDSSVVGTTKSSAGSPDREMPNPLFPTFVFTPPPTTPYCSPSRLEENDGSRENGDSSITSSPIYRFGSASSTNLGEQHSHPIFTFRQLNYVTPNASPSSSPTPQGSSHQPPEFIWSSNGSPGWGKYASTSPSIQSYDMRQIGKDLDLLSLDVPSFSDPSSTSASGALALTEPLTPERRTTSLGASPIDASVASSCPQPLFTSSSAKSITSATSKVSPPSTAVATACGSTLPAKPTHPQSGIAYDPKNETVPAHQFFSPSFQSSLTAGRKLVGEIVKTMHTLDSQLTTDDNVSFKRLVRDAEELQAFRPSDTRTLAVLGDSGCGKSSLINSLLHCPRISEANDHGSAVTSVITEYRYRRKDQKAPLFIEVDFLPSSQRKTLIYELVWSYRRVYLPVDETDPYAAQNYQEFEAESEQAWSALEAAFGHQNGFSSDFLRGSLSRLGAERMSSEEIKTENELIGAQLVKWSEELSWPSESETGLWSTSALDATDGARKIKPFIQNAIWPFTKLIRIFLDAQVLESGLILADLPGLQDTNLARVRSTQRYLTQSDYVLVVAKISRAVTDKSLRGSLYHCIAQHSPTEWEESPSKINFAVVCTGSDDIDLESARDSFCGEGKAVSPEIFSQLENDEVSAREKNDRVGKSRAKNRRKLLLIAARNQHVKQRLQAAYNAKIRGRELPVFCVSNKLYWKYNKEGNDDLVQGSGIPSLRRFCQGITADARLAESMNLLCAKIPQLLSSLQVWTLAYPQATKRDVQIRSQAANMANEIESGIKEIGHTLAKFQTSFQDLSQTQLLCYLDQRREFWVQAALDAESKWKDWYAIQYSAWCNKDGNHKTPPLGHVDWNANFIWKMRTELEYPWLILEDDIPKLFEILERDLTYLIRRIWTSAPALSLSSISVPLARSCQLSCENLTYKLSREQVKMTREIHGLRRRLFDSHEDSFVRTALTSTYREAVMKTGPGQRKAQRTIMRKPLGSGDLFNAMFGTLADAFTDLLASTRGQIFQDAKEIVDQFGEAVMIAGESSRSQKMSEDAAKVASKVKAVEQFNEQVVGFEAMCQEIVRWLQQRRGL